MQHNSPDFPNSPILSGSPVTTGGLSFSTIFRNQRRQ
jgi:hypothetical protein